MRRTKKKKKKKEKKNEIGQEKVAAIIFASVSFSTPSSSLAWHFHALFRP
jgi:hypothetical protein